MDNLRFYVLFNSISVISGPWLGDNERLCAMEPRLQLERFLPQVRLEPRTARSVGQRLTYQAGGNHSPSKIAADDTFIIFTFIFWKKIRLDVLCESSAKQRIHMKHRALFYQKNNEKIIKTVQILSMIR